MLRFAPSPTGDLHIKDLRVALFNYIYSKQMGESFSIRIEDLETSHVVEDKDKEILGLLSLFGIEHETVTYQSESKKRHQLLALQLINTQRAFNCFCSKDKLQKEQEAAAASGNLYYYDGSCENLPAEQTIDNTNPFCVRIKKPLTTIEFSDKILGEQCFKPEDIGSFIVLNHDKLPTQIFASAVDDMISDISIIIEEQSQLADAPKEMAVRAALGYTKAIEYAHIPAMRTDNQIMSVKALIEQGILPVSIVNYLLGLGNNMPKEIFDLREAVTFFDLNMIGKNQVVFDIKTLLEINKKHLFSMDDVELSRYVGFADADIGKAAKLFLQEASTTKELKSKIESIFCKKPETGELGSLVKQFKEIFKDAPHFNTFSDMKDYIMQNSGANEKDFPQALRLLLTGQTAGPDLEQLYMLIKNYIAEITK